MTDDDEMETKEDMSELIASSQFDFNFSYGGSTISAEEMLVRTCHLCSGVQLYLCVCNTSWFIERCTTELLVRNRFRRVKG